jgi:tetratricopeptide (TPR) repeat protein
VRFFLFLVALSPVARAETILGFALPSRRNDPAAQSRAAKVAETLAAREQLRAVATVPLDLGVRFTRARAFYKAGKLDQAAAALDEAIGEGARDPERLSQANEWVSAKVLRISMALARGEAEQARRLFARLLRYDPTFELTASESRPQVTSAFDELRRQLGDRLPLFPEDLGEACRAADVLIVGRVLAQDTVEIFRFDGCVLTAQSRIPVGMSNEEASQVFEASSQNALKKSKAHFEAGQTLYRVGDFAGAIRELSVGYQLSPRPEFLLNQAQAYRALKDAEKARALLSQFLAEAPDHPARRTVEELMAELSVSAPSPPPTAPKRSPSVGPPLAVGVVGAVAMITGVGLAASVFAPYNQLDSTCGRSGTCTADSYANLKLRYQAGVGLSIGGAVLVGAALIWGLAARFAHRSR